MGKEEKASFWLSLDHPFVDSWRSDISLSIPSCWVFLQHLTSFKASPLTSIDTDGREGERSCREGKSFWYQALISLVFIVKSLTISLTLNFFQVLYIQQRAGLFCFVSRVWLLILLEFFFSPPVGKEFETFPNKFGKELSRLYKDSRWVPFLHNSLSPADQ